MFFFTLAFLVGDMYLQRQAQLPSLVTSNLIFGIVLIGFFIRINHITVILLGLMAGFSCASWHAYHTLQWTLPRHQEGQAVLIEGYVANLPQLEHGQASFLLETDRLNQTNISPVLIRMGWMQPQHLRVGDRMRLWVKLKRIHGTQNPSTFDSEALALQKNIRATGYVIRHKHNQFLSHHYLRYPIETIRQLVQTKLSSHLPHSQTSAWLQALMLGVRVGIAEKDWQILRHTGTNHLMAIAGLHIGFLAASIHFIVMGLWRRFPRLTLSCPASLAGAFAALFIAIFYSLLSGFALPAQRACFMLSALTLMLLLRRPVSLLSVWLFALFMVLLIDPAVILTESFWLSFGTLAFIIYGMTARLAPTGFWWKWGRVQWVISIGLIPFSLWLYQETSLIAFLANAIAIPWLTLFILPLCLLGLPLMFLLPAAATLLLQMADFSMQGLWWVLTHLSDYSLAVWSPAMGAHGWYFILVAVLLLLAPTGFPGRYVGLFYLLPLFFSPVLKPTVGNVSLTVLDVGQGLSVVVETHAHVLVYDAGPAILGNRNMGSQVVLPYLRQQGIQYLDTMVISHGDNDHIGGAAAVLKNMPTQSILSSVPDKLREFSAQYCLAGYTWRWDGVNFSFLYPTKAELGRNNDSSCVLKIDNGTNSILLTGDIERYGEEQLLARHLSKLKATILIAPHHGSKTSGYPAFINAVHPQFVVYATAYRNRYHFPHPSVVSAYRVIKAEDFNTADTGAIFFELNKNDRAVTPLLYRQSHHRYWYEG